MERLILEVKPQANKSPTIVSPDAIIRMSPPVGGDYWKFRVQVAPNQAIVGFPKFTTVGIGFQIEEADWNTNMPFTEPAERILKHIWVNRGPGNEGKAFRTRCLVAIGLIQSAAGAHEN